MIEKAEVEKLIEEIKQKQKIATEEEENAKIKKIQLAESNKEVEE